jgi:hypothetical protein
MSAARFTLDIAAWDAGFAAGEAGQALTASPYPNGSNESLSWHSGFIEGKAGSPGTGTPESGFAGADGQEPRAAGPS